MFVFPFNKFSHDDIKILYTKHVNNTRIQTQGEIRISEINQTNDQSTNPEPTMNHEIPKSTPQPNQLSDRLINSHEKN
jgi:hypothetical protein